MDSTAASVCQTVKTYHNCHILRGITGFHHALRAEVHGCMDAVEGKLIPLMEESDKSSAQATKKHEETMLLEKTEFIDQHIIVCSLSNQERQLVNMCMSAKEMWDKLHSVYEQRTQQQQDCLFNEFYSIREKDPHNSVAIHIAKLGKLWVELQDETWKADEAKLPDSLFLNREKDEQCIACLEGKQFRKPFKAAEDKRVSQCLQLVHSDVCGRTSQESWSGGRSKVEVFEKFREFKAQVEQQTGKQIKILRTHNGSEYVNRGFKNFLRNQEIKHELTIPYSPKQNGLAEHTNHTLVEKARCMMKKAGSNEKMWAEAVNTAAYLANRSPHKATGVKTAEEWWCGRKVNLAHLHVFGCIAYGHIEKEKHKKKDCTLQRCCALEDKFSVNEQESSDMTTVDARLHSMDIESGKFNIGSRENMEYTEENAGDTNPSEEDMSEDEFRGFELDLRPREEEGPRIKKLQEKKF
ncbi:hypothetical protein PR048_011757 [Dryococelus australis]|uniref:Integrase catalytic domain-containing protein n=1 Tax=Dryococelus australis TaxID=614101 RepID=A0ABQ9HMI3_9NEOP|nr:hypothetical protein PR048_011757 [Dryococelus australis]